MTNSDIKILLIEDSEDDIFFISLEFKEAKMLNNLDIIKSGKEAIRFLQKANNYKNPPALIIIGIHYSSVENQIKVLNKIKSDKNLKNIPIAFLTTGKEFEEKIIGLYNPDVNFYLTKPVKFEEIIKIINLIPIENRI